MDMTIQDRIITDLPTPFEECEYGLHSMGLDE